jgi:hypothetical protein
VSGTGNRLLALDERVFRFLARGAGVTYDVSPPRWTRPAPMVTVLVVVVISAIYWAVAITVSPWVGLPIILLPELAYGIALVAWSRRHRQAPTR